MPSKRKNRKTQTAVEIQAIAAMPVDLMAPPGVIEVASAEEIAAILTEAQTDVPTGEIDHHSQAGSRSPPDEEPIVTCPEVAILDDPEAELHRVAEKALPPASPAVEELQGNADSQPQPRVTFHDVMALVSDEEVDRMVWATAAALDKRTRFEERVDPDNVNIHRTLKKARAEIVTKAAARVMVAANVDVAFINRSIHEGARYNVYAIGKFADIVKGLETGSMRNAINRACIRSLFDSAKAGVTFTMALARGAASVQVAKRLPAELRKHLTSHTVAPSTAPTQASSTMQALATLRIIKVVGSSRNPSYEILEGPATDRLKDLLAA